MPNKPFDRMTLGERLDFIDRKSEVGDLIYRTIEDLILKGRLGEMDRAFGVKHRTYSLLGAGMTGSGISEVGVMRERTDGNRVSKSLRPYDHVISISLSSGFFASAGSVQYSKGYDFFAHEIKKDYDGMMARRVDIPIYTHQSR